MKYKLRLLSLKCYLADESDGDEIYLKLNNKKIWPVDAKFVHVVNESTKIDLEMIINKGDKLAFDLWDYDLLSADDHLGQLSIVADAHGHFQNEFSKTRKDKSKYALEWELG